MIVLGIDPGTIRCGFGFVEIAGSMRHVESGVMRFSRKLERWERIQSLHRRVGLLDGPHAIGAIAIEEAFIHPRYPKSGLAVGEARGAVFSAFADLPVGMFEYAPASIKKAVAGTGRATKEQMRRAVSALLRLDFDELEEDQADALAIAICHATSRRAI